MTQNNKKNNLKVDNLTYPLRINRYLSLKNYTTRRGADELIRDGHVTINGKKAQLGDKVEEHDKVIVSGGEKKEYVYLAYYKPRGVVTIGAQDNEQEISNILELESPVFPLGRLDKDSEGLIILTNDGRITEKLLSPQYEHQKEYSVEVDHDITHSFLVHMKSGVRIDVGRKKYKTKPPLVRKTGKRSFDIVLTEGKNRQIRKMCGSLGYKVVLLKRIRIENIEIANLKPGQYKKIRGKDLKQFLEKLK